jgi:hypothetical protein
MGRTSPTLRRAWPKDGPLAAICVQSVDVQCVLQFTLIHAAGCVLHRRTSRVIHRLKLFSFFGFRFSSSGRVAPPIPGAEARARTEAPPSLQQKRSNGMTRKGRKKMGPRGGALLARTRRSLNLRPESAGRGARAPDRPAPCHLRASPDEPAGGKGRGREKERELSLSSLSTLPGIPCGPGTPGSQFWREAGRDASPACSSSLVFA